MDPRFLSKVLDEGLSLQGTLRSLREELPSVLRRGIHHLAEVAPEVAGHVGLTARGRHIHFGTLELAGDSILFLSQDFLFEGGTRFGLLPNNGFVGRLSRIRTLGTKELVDIISQNVRVSEDQVGSSVLFTSSFKHGVHAVATLDLLNQSVFNGTGVLVKQSGSFSTKVLKNFQGLVRDSVQIGITCVCLTLCGCLLNQIGDLGFRVALG